MRLSVLAVVVVASESHRVSFVEVENCFLSRMLATGLVVVEQRLVGSRRRRLNNQVFISFYEF